MPTALADEMLKPRELAELLHCNYYHLMRSYRELGIPYVTFAGRILFPRKGVDQWIAQRTRVAA